MKRASYLILRGLVGISASRYISTSQKTALYIDYTRLIFLALQLPFRPELVNSKVDKVFYVHALNLTIHYPNIFPFFFLFTEIFCIQEYPAQRNIQTYVDLGAYIGMSILWYHAFNPQAKIYAFEPNEENYRFLLKNVAANHVDRCVTYKVALSNSSRQVKYYQILDNIQSLDSGLFLNQKLPYKTTFVKSERLSDRIKKIGEISLLKIDIEGSEYAVFEDLFASKSLRKIKKIIFESHLFNQKNKTEHAQLLRSLRRFGKVTANSNSKLTSIDTWQRMK